jgi:hypothetical protein
MNFRVTYEHSLSTAPDDFIVQVPAQVVTDVPDGTPREQLPEVITALILERSPSIGKIRFLRVLG